jgi:glycosyltransferase involved in cell wall biosynthesis
MMQKPQPWPNDIYILIPAYKAAESVHSLLVKLADTVPLANVCVVDDGSNDGTDDVCTKNKVEYLRLPVNRGKGKALMFGFDHLITKKHASWIITMDADGQHAISDLPKFLYAIKTLPHCGIIIGKRAKTLACMPVPRILSNTLTSAIMSVFTGKDIMDSQCGYRAYNASFLSRVRCRYSHFEMESEIILRACSARFSISFVPVQTLYCSTQSHISHVQDTLRWIKAVLSVQFELQTRNKQ